MISEGGLSDYFFFLQAKYMKRFKKIHTRNKALTPFPSEVKWSALKRIVFSRAQGPLQCLLNAGECTKKDKRQKKSIVSNKENIIPPF